MPETHFTTAAEGRTDGEALEIRPPEWHALTNSQRNAKLETLQNELGRQAQQLGLRRIDGSDTSTGHHLRAVRADLDERRPVVTETAWMRASGQFTQICGDR